MTVRPRPSDARPRRSALARAVAAAVFALLTACSGGDDDPGVVDAVSAGGGTAAPTRPAKNVLLIVVDTLRADRLGCYGYPRETSPHIDALAARGTLYTEARAQGSWTIPSMISLLTGTWVTAREERLPELPTLGERAREGGLVTAAILANSVLSTDRGFDRGFDHFESLRKGRAHDVLKAFRRWYVAEEEAIAERGFFVWLQPADPHTAYDPAERFKLFGRAPLHEGLGLLDPAEIMPEAAPDGPEVEAVRREVAEQVALYDGEVRATDDAVGKLLDFLDKRGALDDTLVLLASDHGEELFERPRYPEELSYASRDLGPGERLPPLERMAFRHGELSEAVLRTPLLLAGPGVPEGRRVGGLAANVDLYPTVLVALGLQRPGDDELPGRSLLGGAAPVREAVFSFGYEAAAVVDAEGRKLIDRRRLLAARRDRPGVVLPPPEEARALELYEPRDDPHERRDLSADEPGALRELEATLEAWRAAHARETDTGVSEQDLEALRQMGYIEGG